MLPEEKIVVDEIAGVHADTVWNLILGAVISQVWEKSNFAIPVSFEFWFNQNKELGFQLN